MLTTLKITRLTIEHIDHIEDTEVKEYEELGYSSRTLTIWTTDGEQYELILEAAAPGQLELLKRSIDDWLSPKVYQGNTEGQ